MSFPPMCFPGAEYDRVAETAARFRSRFSALHLGRPLLWDTAGVRALARVLDGLWPRTPGTAAVLVGHGSEHPGSMAYPALQGALDLMGRADLVVGTVEGWPDREAVLKRLEELRAERVLLLPLLLAAGVHAREDIAGPGPGQLEQRPGGGRASDSGSAGGPGASAPDPGPVSGGTGAAAGGGGGRCPLNTM